MRQWSLRRMQELSTIVTVILGLLQWRGKPHPGDEVSDPLPHPHRWSTTAPCVQPGIAPQMGFEAYEINKHMYTVNVTVNGERKFLSGPRILPRERGKYFFYIIRTHTRVWTTGEGRSKIAPTISVRLLCHPAHPPLQKTEPLIVCGW